MDPKTLNEPASFNQSPLGREIKLSDKIRTKLSQSSLMFYAGNSMVGIMRSFIGKYNLISSMSKQTNC